MDGQTFIPPAALICLQFSFLEISFSWLLSFNLFPWQVPGSSSHRGRLVWVSLTGQIEVSLLPLLAEDMEGEGRRREGCKEKEWRKKTCNVKMSAGMQEVILQHLSRMLMGIMLIS